MKRKGYPLKVNNVLIMFLLLIPIYYIIKKILLLKNYQRLYSYFLGIIAFCLTVSMVFYPKEAFSAAVTGLDVWWNIVFPALLPFFIGSEILMGLGVVHFMGVLLEPLMRPVFKVPGVGSFVMAMGLASGFPIGSILTTKMRKKKLVSKYEGERLMSFTNTADPLFMFGAVAVGMFSNPQVGATIAAAHYLSTLSVGLLMRFHGKDKKTIVSNNEKGNIFIKAFNALYNARKTDNRPLGQLMGDAIRNSVNTLLLIGGFIILFSVIIKILEAIGIVSILSSFLFIILKPLGLDVNLSPAIISGFFEVTMGCQLAANAPSTVLLNQKIIITGAVIAWSGLSVHAQVASIISETDMNITPFIIARGIHALLAGFYTYLILGPLSFVTGPLTLPVFLHTQPQGSSWIFWWERTLFASQKFAIIMLAMLIISMSIQTFVHFSKK